MNWNAVWFVVSISFYLQVFRFLVKLWGFSNYLMELCGKNMLLFIVFRSLEVAYPLSFRQWI